MHAEVEEPAAAALDPALAPLVRGAGLDEELDLHRLELGVRKMNYTEVIWFRFDLPIWLILNGTFLR